MSDNVKVAVRVRPFNDREKSRNSKLIIEMNGQQTEITNPENAADKKKFSFDYSYWSHDGYKERKDGYLEPANSKYADQQKVFNELGKGVLDNAWKGYNCSLFAYGQTGSGKSYSMVGYGNNKGIVPVCCEELFKAIQIKKQSLKEGEEYQVSVSMLEIYNEQVRDLLQTKVVKGGLKVRQHPEKGFYVDGLTISPVKSYTDIDGKIEEGTKNRTVAATNMNATSSRAHTIVAINFTQKSSESGKNMTKVSIVNLVDLAGSERAASTGATGDRLKEGSAINQSLSTLGNCIKALADQSLGSSKVQVPFRDSVLTKLLKNALGGNSKTIMIAALSPADINYDETLSTLRFADRAKAIKTKAIVNESPTDKLIRELKEENARLLAALKSGGIGGLATDADDNSSEAERLAEIESLQRKAEQDMNELNQAWEERLKNAEKAALEKVAQQKDVLQRKKNTPHFWNLNEDPSLCGMIVHFCDEGTTLVGQSDSAKIQLKGLNIQKEHCQVINKSNQVTLTPCGTSKTLVNGNLIGKECLLHHNDRVLFGNNHLYVFHHPADYAKQEKSGNVTASPSFETAQEEIVQKQNNLVGLMGSHAGGKTEEDLLLQQDLIEILPMVGEANAMSEELDKNVAFEIVLLSPQSLGKKNGRTEVCVKMKNMTSGNDWLWDRNKFINRKYIMQEMYQNFLQGDTDWNLPQDKDPFWEPIDAEQLIGTVHIYLQSLGYLVEFSDNLAITDYKGNSQGHLSVDIRPCDSTWKELVDEFVDNPTDLIGKQLFVKLKIANARGLPEKYAKSFFRYKFYLDDNYTTSHEIGKIINPDYNHERQLTFSPVTKQLVEYLNESYFVIEVWGRQRVVATMKQTSTKELMNKENASVSKLEVDKGLQKELAALKTELAASKKKHERLDIKIKQLQKLVNDARKKGNTTLSIIELDKVLAQSSSEPQMKSTNNAAAENLKSEKQRSEALGKNTSAACSLQ